MDDLIDSDFGKHDYDWLLTPPETPVVVPSSLPSELQRPSTSLRSSTRSNVRSVSTTRASKVSTSPLQNGHSPKPARSSSLTRPSILNSHSSPSNNNNTSRTSTRHTSIASHSSKPSNPGNHNTTTRSSLTLRPAPARPQTPAKASPIPISAGAKTTRPHISRPSTGHSRSQIPTSSSPTVTSSSPRHNFGSSTPSLRLVIPLPTPTTYKAASVGRVRNPPAASKPPGSQSPRARVPVQPIDKPDFPRNAPPNLRTSLPRNRAGYTTQPSSLSARVRVPIQPIAIPDFSSDASPNHRTSLPRNRAGSATRPNTPSPRARVPVQPTDIPDFSSDVPPNLRTRLCERPASVGKVRPGTAISPKDNLNSQNLRNNGNVGALSEIPKNVVSGVRKTNKVNDGAAENTGFERTRSKNSLDMALRHMDIKQSHASKCQFACRSDPVVPVTTNEVSEIGSYNGTATPDLYLSVSYDGDFSANTSPEQKPNPLVTRERYSDLYGSSRYDAMLLKGDSRNLNWLHSLEDKCDHSSEFDQRFESLPEPFELL